MNINFQMYVSVHRWHRYVYVHTICIYIYTYCIYIVYIYILYIYIYCIYIYCAYIYNPKSKTKLHPRSRKAAKVAILSARPVASFWTSCLGLGFRALGF